ncbi:flagellar export chaperone FlgN [Aliikangiella sp. IMCC44653]
MKNRQLAKTLINVWKQDYQTLYDCLNQEQRALEKRDFDGLSCSVKEKDEMVAKINSHQVPPMLSDSGTQILSQGQFAEFCLSCNELSGYWKELMGLVKKCCLKNEVNARLIELINVSSQRTFNLIKGFDPDNNIYNAKGNRTTVRYHNDSVSA